MRQAQHATLAEHDVEVEVLRQTLEQLQRLLVKVRALVPQVVGPDDGGVAPGVAAADPPFLEDGNVGDAVFLGQVIGRRQTVPAATHDDHIVFGLRLGAAPGARPFGVTMPGIPGQAENGITSHGASSYRSNNRRLRL